MPWKFRTIHLYINHTEDLVSIMQFGNEANLKLEPSNAMCVVKNTSSHLQNNKKSLYVDTQQEKFVDASVFTLIILAILQNRFTKLVKQ